MCLGGSSQPDYTPRYLQRTDPPPGPTPPPDMVNDMEISDTGDFSQKPKAKTKTNRSSLNAGMY